MQNGKNRNYGKGYKHSFPNDDSVNPVVRSIITNDRVIDGTREEVAFNLKPSKVLIFDKETEERIRYGENNNKAWLYLIPAILFLVCL